MCIYWASSLCTTVHEMGCPKGEGLQVGWPTLSSRCMRLQHGFWCDQAELARLQHAMLWSMQGGVWSATRPGAARLHHSLQ